MIEIYPFFWMRCPPKAQKPLSLLDGHLFISSVSSLSLAVIYPDTDLKILIHTLNFVLSLSLLYCPFPMFYFLVMILKPWVHLKYHVVAMGALLHDCSYCLMLSKKCTLKGGLSTFMKIITCWLRTLKLMSVFLSN